MDGTRRCWPQSAGRHRNGRRIELPSNKYRNINNSIGSSSTPPQSATLAGAILLSLFSFSFSFSFFFGFPLQVSWDHRRHVIHVSLTGFYRILWTPNASLLGFTGFYLVLLVFFLVLQRLTGFDWVLVSFSGFYLVLLGFTEFYGSHWVLSGFHGWFSV